MPRPKRSKNPVVRSGPLASHLRGQRQLTNAQKEAVLRTYHMTGTYTGVARILGLSYATVKRVVLQHQLDPSFAHTRAQAFDEMSGKVSAITDQVLESITPEELVTKSHKVYDASGNLLRIVQEGPALRDKALAVGILLDKTAVLQNARSKALSISDQVGGGPALLLPDNIQDMRDMLATKVKSLRIMDIHFQETELGQHVDKLIRKVGVQENDITDAEVEPIAVGGEPFDF